MEQELCMHRLFTIGSLIIIFNLALVRADLFHFNDPVVYDNNADLCWYRPLFKISQLGEYEREYETFLKGIEFLNSESALVSDRWGFWYVANQKEINTLLKSDLFQFIYFEMNDESRLLYDFERMYDKVTLKSTKLVRDLFVSIPDTAVYNISLEEPSPAPNIARNRFTSKDDASVGAVGAMGIWAAATGKSNVVPEMSIVGMMLSGLFVLLIWAKREASPL